MHSALVQAALHHQFMDALNSQEILGFKTCHPCFEPWSNLFTCDRTSLFTYVNEYMAIDIGGRSYLM